MQAMSVRVIVVFANLAQKLRPTEGQIPAQTARQPRNLGSWRLLATIREVLHQKFPHNNISQTIQELEREGLFKIPQNGRYIDQEGARLE
jgi:hypothetical protein